MGKGNRQVGPAVKKTKKSKQKQQLPAEEEYPFYENDDEIPIYDPQNVAASISKQKQKKKKKKKIVEQPEEPELEEEAMEHQSPQQDFNQIEQEIMDEDLPEEPEQNDEQMEEQQEEQIEGADVDDMAEAPGKQKKQISMSIIQTKIQEILSILGNFSALSGGKPRKQYLAQLKQHIKSYYDYNDELIEHFMSFLSPNEMVQLIEANEQQRPLTLRVNTLKTRRKQLAQALIQRGVNLDPLAEWSKVGIKIYESRVPIGATPQYLAGHYMPQSASSLLPVMALDAQPGQRILDMAAAPGGKTTYIAQTMKNTGVVFANDFKKERLRALQFNVQRLGISNVIVTNYDGRKFTKIMTNFDRVLLDAPCTGLGIISKDQSIKAQKLLIDIQKHSHLQKQLILSAIDCTRPNGIIVYSTCSISPLENEQVVNYALRKRFVKILPIELEVGEPGITKYVDKRYHPTIAQTRRIYPHIVNMDGFYVAKLLKISNGQKKESKEDEIEEAPVEQQGPMFTKNDKKEAKDKQAKEVKEHRQPKQQKESKKQKQPNEAKNKEKKHIEQPEQPEVKRKVKKVEGGMPPKTKKIKKLQS